MNRLKPLANQCGEEHQRGAHRVSGREKMSMPAITGNVTGTGRHGRSPRRVEEMLREIAYVLHVTKRVKAEMLRDFPIRSSDCCRDRQPPPMNAFGPAV